jgi:hypothetical protein
MRVMKRERRDADADADGDGDGEHLITRRGEEGEEGGTCDSPIDNSLCNNFQSTGWCKERPSTL